RPVRSGRRGPTATRTTSSCPRGEPMTQSLPAGPSDLSTRRAQMFPVLSQEQVARVAAFAVETRFEPGAIVFDQGDELVPFYVVLEGELEVVHPRGDAEDPITVHRAREFTGEVNLLTDRRSLARGRAKGSLLTLRVEHARLRSLIQTDPELSEVFL